MSDREMSDARDGIEERKSYGFRDPVVRKVCDKLVQRSDVGFAKYGSTLEDERRLKMKNLQGYLKDIQEELMDAVLYLQKAKEVYTTEEQERMNELFDTQKCHCGQQR